MEMQDLIGAVIGI